MGATHKLEGLVSICLVKSCLDLLLPRELREIWALVSSAAGRGLRLGELLGRAARTHLMSLSTLSASSDENSSLLIWRESAIARSRE